MLHAEFGSTARQDTSRRMTLRARRFRLKPRAGVKWLANFGRLAGVGVMGVEVEERKEGDERIVWKECDRARGENDRLQEKRAPAVVVVAFKWVAEMVRRRQGRAERDNPARLLEIAVFLESMAMFPLIL